MKWNMLRYFDSLGSVRVWQKAQEITLLVNLLGPSDIQLCFLFSRTIHGIVFVNVLQFDPNIIISVVYLQVIKVHQKYL